MSRTSLSECPVNTATSASVEPAKARRVNAAPRKSWNVRPSTPALAQSLRQEDRKPCSVHALPVEFVRMTVLLLRFAASSRANLRGPPTGIATRAPVFDCLRRIQEPSYPDHGSLSRSPWRCPVQAASRTPGPCMRGSFPGTRFRLPPSRSCRVATLSRGGRLSHTD
jgi:hypothetical protein